uniref:Serine/threonine-protein kinase 38-like isoform X3 n=2 Tax=Rhizophora mucronata TaxID=61149 RepID=A0A2P2L0K0_RHIMU
MQMLLTPKDLSFVGYTYKNFEAVKALRHFGNSGADYTTKPADESEMQVLAFPGDPMLP